jgi:antitoxin (DNA-binding transcriptional repressor) of toxin-antitoxin stability system
MGVHLCTLLLVLRVGIRVLRANVADAVQRAARGERLVITVGGRPAAQLGPLDAGSGPESLDDLVSRGLVMAPRRTDLPRPTEPVPVWSGARLDRLLREIRG